MIAQIDPDDPNSMANAGMSFNDNVLAGFGQGDEQQMQDWVKRQKSEIKELQGKLDVSKKEFKKSQAEVESLRLEDPNLYRKKHAVLDKVKV